MSSSAISEFLIVAASSSVLPLTHSVMREELAIADPHSPIEMLSVGQQQRVAVARAVAGEPCVVLADEPTASLDPANARVAIELIKEAARAAGAALIVTSHDPSLREAFTRIVEVSQFAPTEAVR